MGGATLVIRVRDAWVVLPGPSGLVPASPDCSNRQHVALSLASHRIEHLLVAMFERGLTVESVSDWIDVSAERLSSLLSGATSRTTPLLSVEDLQLLAAECADDWRECTSLNDWGDRPRLFHYRGDVYAWGHRPRPPFTPVAIWQTTQRWLIAAHVLAEIQWVFRLPCWCDGLAWWHANLRPPLDTPSGPLFGHSRPRSTEWYGRRYDPVLGPIEWHPVSAAIHLDDEGELTDEEVLAQVEHDPASYVEHYLRRCLESLHRDGPRMFKLAELTRNPVLAVWHNANARDPPERSRPSPDQALARDLRLEVARGQRAYRIDAPRSPP